ncbi:carboxymuconolactone decarboxylase family protein [Pseudoalteromonas denitrificans]|uniref:Alkylhydroperoxidase AhpD family core domain-containing protein n=1 Tax=Pseudoalteromonas denitrificans DSM 6059 TaxID=1123010 RepID=A0A1I1PYB7_9GAMM|nr:carboxymuconolactone decarboxylase family protein [Pseudoalteromonas denitrificans]SFD14662.1 alkylhydroperoxidase AhpD family core domain-containing protein [Pseudoalteromonas denitrificans DSM 6059]
MTDFTFHTLESSQGETKELLSSIQQGYGFLPNLFAYMIEAPTSVQAYLMLNDLLAKTSIPMPQLQVALLAASIENKCDFCTVAHRAIGKQMGAEPASLNALNNGDIIESDKDRAIAEFTISMIKNRGFVPEKDTQAFLSAGYTQQQILEVILIVTIKTLSNYSNHFTQPKPNAELLNML